MDTDISGRQQRRRTSGGVFFRTARFRYHLNDEQVAARDQIIDDNFCQFQERFQIFFPRNTFSTYSWLLKSLKGSMFARNASWWQCQGQVAWSNCATSIIWSTVRAKLTSHTGTVNVTVLSL